MKAIRFAFAALLVVTSAYAQDDKTDESGSFLRYARNVLAVEAGAAMISGVAILDPQIFGGAMVFGAWWIPNDHPVGSALMLGTAGVGVYNIVELDKDEDTDSEIFQRNLIGWNIVAVAAGITYLATDDEQDRQLHFQYRPLADGGMVRATYVFK